MSRAVEVLELPAGPDVLRILPELAAAARGDGPVRLPVPAGSSPPALPGPLAPDEDDPADPTAFVIATSGSTGSAKGALLTVGGLAASADATARRLLAAGPDPTWLLALPADHIAGLQVLLRSIRAGTTPVVMETRHGFAPTAFRAAVRRMPSGPRLTALVPTQLRRLLADPGAAAALGTFTAVLVGGASTAPQLARAAREAGVPVVLTYGMTETSGGCVYDGVPLDGVAVRVDPARGPGRIAITGAVVARGYRSRPGDPAFAPDSVGAGTSPTTSTGTSSTSARTFWTGDLGLLDDAGRLTVLGRADDVLISGGVNVEPSAVERALAGVPGVGEVVVTGVGDDEWGDAIVAVVVPSPAGPPPELTALRRAATAAWGAPAAPRHLLVVDALPLRGPGKPDRAAIRRLVADARLG